MPFKVTTTMTKIIRQAVTSSQVAAIGYSATTKEMDVEYKPFKNGLPNSVYRYQNVPAELHAQIMDAESIGKAINSTVKKDKVAFPYRKLTPEEAAQS